MSVNDINSLSHTKWNCKYHLVFAPKYRRLVFYKNKKDIYWENFAGTLQMERGEYCRG